MAVFIQVQSAPTAASSLSAWAKGSQMLGKRQPQTVLTAWLVEILPRVVGYHL